MISILYLKHHKSNFIYKNNFKGYLYIKIKYKKFMTSNDI